MGCNSSYTHRISLRMSRNLVFPCSLPWTQLLLEEFIHDFSCKSAGLISSFTFCIHILLFHITVIQHSLRITLSYFSFSGILFFCPALIKSACCLDHISFGVLFNHSTYMSINASRSFLFNFFSSVMLSNQCSL